MSLVANIRALFDQPSVNGHKPGGPGDFWAPFRGGGLGYAQAALVRECDEVEHAPQGQRNHALNSAAFSLGQLVAGGELGRDEVERALTQAGGRAGLGAVEMERTIASGLRSGALQPRTIPAPALLLPVGVTKPVVLAVVETVEEPTEAEQVLEHLPALDWHALWKDDTAEDWIVEPLLPARRLIALYSAPKIGKSLLMLELAVGVSLGGTVLGATVDRPRRVLYVDFENDPKGDIRERLMAMGYGPDDLTGLKYLSFPALAALDSAPGGQQLMAAVRTYQCEVVVIDTVSRAIQGEENENDTWLNFYRHTGKALKAAGIALIRLDHSGKDETRGQRGGSAKSGDVDAVWRMSTIKPDEVYQLDCEAHRMPVAETTLVLHRHKIPHLRHTVDAAGRASAFEIKVKEVLDALNSFGVNRSAGRPAVKEVLKSTGVRASTGAVEEAIRRRKGIDVD